MTCYVLLHCNIGIIEDYIRLEIMTEKNCNGDVNDDIQFE